MIQFIGSLVQSANTKFILSARGLNASFAESETRQQSDIHLEPKRGQSLMLLQENIYTGGRVLYSLYSCQPGTELAVDEMKFFCKIKQESPQLVDDSLYGDFSCSFTNLAASEIRTRR